MTAYTNSKGFKVIKASMQEVVAIGGYGICDSCSSASFYGNIIPALNGHWYCEKCYQEWLKRAKYYEEDREFEARCNEYYLNLLQDKGAKNE